ncbi:MAG: hypothetical protein CM1200mP18_15710 [Gammaproteobacteria bacterium]|nr:MAG: hypothetical protein CM1200mP18_15710 [Gammaproteobacteria bacterium]
MKLVTFTRSGKQSYGFVDNEKITELDRRWPVHIPILSL